MDKFQIETFQIETPRIDQAQKRKALAHIAEAAEQKKDYYLPSGWEILRGQIKYTSRYCLGGQILFSAFIFFLFWQFKEAHAAIEQYLAAASVLMACTGIFLIMELSRGQMAGMSEIEETCYLNLKQVWCIKMILFGSVDAVVFSCVLGALAGNGSIGAIRLCLYLLVPFVLSNAGYLLVFSLLRGKEKLYIQMGMAVMVSIGAAFPAGIPGCYTSAYAGIWAAVLAAALLALGTEAAVLCRKLEKGEEICWN